MTARCPDMTDTDTVIRTFQCVLDAGHEGPHVPYHQPTVDEWREQDALRRCLAGRLAEAQEPCPGCGL